MTSLHPIEYRASDATTQTGRGGRRSPLSSLLRRLKSFADWLDDSWLGAALGVLVIFGFMIAVPVLLPIIFEVLK